jgi:predicted MPP superfamily phosphohydrolase
MHSESAHSDDEGDSPALYLNALPPVFGDLAERMGPELLAKRLSAQASCWVGLEHQGEGILAIERFIPLDAIVRLGLKISGLAPLGLRGARDLRIEQNTIFSPQVPCDLDGFRILQLSDLHLDLDPGFLPHLLGQIGKVEYDLVLITGDYRNSTSGDFARSLQETGHVLSHLKTPVYGVLGNHDFIEMAPYLEDMGLNLLLNEWVVVKRGCARLVIAGIDDPHFYRTHDLEKAASGPIGDNTFRVLMSHSPETYREAAEFFDLQLSGHTHGGQICLPGGIALIRNGNCPAALISGPWQWKWNDKIMHGYTSRGTGCCGVAARFFCPPEITIHTLRRQE